MFPTNGSKKLSQHLWKTRVGTLSEEGSRQKNHLDKIDNKIYTEINILHSLKKQFKKKIKKEKNLEQVVFTLRLFKMHISKSTTDFLSTP